MIRANRFAQIALRIARATKVPRFDLLCDFEALCWRVLESFFSIMVDGPLPQTLHLQKETGHTLSYSSRESKLPGCQKVSVSCLDIIFGTCYAIPALS